MKTLAKILAAVFPPLLILCLTTVATAQTRVVVNPPGLFNRTVVKTNGFGPGVAVNAPGVSVNAFNGGFHNTAFAPGVNVNVAGRRGVNVNVNGFNPVVGSTALFVPTGGFVSTAAFVPQTFVPGTVGVSALGVPTYSGFSSVSGFPVSSYGFSSVRSFCH